jgi:hypothetical protein
LPFEYEQKYQFEVNEHEPKSYWLKTLNLLG